MKITLTYAAQLGKETGCAGESLDLESGTTLVELLARVSDRYPPRFRQLLFDGDQLHRSLIVAIDGAQVRDPGAFPLEQDHEVMLMTPMAGG
ncbi:MAG: MoaD/ThiS family protein [Verrucomicrobiota bacterium]